MGYQPKSYRGYQPKRPKGFVRRLVDQVTTIYFFAHSARLECSMLFLFLVLQVELGKDAERIKFTTSDLENLKGEYDTVLCIDVMIHYPTDKASSSVFYDLLQLRQ